MSFSNKKRHREQGYILVTLMLFVTLLAIASLGWIEKVDFQIRRNREQELIHRGVQYSRAIRQYVRKFGRYPSRLEDLENTNNVRYLRKRYKDPITGKGFRLLRQNDVQMSFSPGAASGLPPGSPDASAGQGAPGGLNANSPAPGGPGPAAGGAAPGPADASSTTTPGPAFGGLRANGAGASMVGPATSNPQSDPAAGNPQQDGQAAANSQDGQSEQLTTDQSSSGDHSTTDSMSQSSSGNLNQPMRGFSSQVSPGGAQDPNGLGNGQFGGLPIVGVASTSKDKTIRVFNKKDRYYQWQFIYDPSTDHGGLLMTPNEPSIQGATPINQMNQPGAQNPGAQNPGPGQPGGLNPPNMQQGTPQQPQNPEQPNSENPPPQNPQSPNPQ